MKLIILFSILASHGLFARDIEIIKNIALLVNSSSDVSTIKKIIPPTVSILNYSKELRLIILREKDGATYALFKSSNISPYENFGVIKMTPPMSVEIARSIVNWEAAKLVKVTDNEITLTLKRKGSEQYDKLSLSREVEGPISSWEIGP